MDVKPFLHEHYLLYDNFEKTENAYCDKCGLEIDGPAFFCGSCKFWLHSSCANQHLRDREKIPHRLHPNHHLTLVIEGEDFICDNCFTLSCGCRYECHVCKFKLDFICASFSTNVQSTTKKGSEVRSCEDKLGEKLKHFSYQNPLVLFKYRKVRKYHYCCNWCGNPLTGLSYGCSSSFKVESFIHKSCLSEIPPRIYDHPFHPLHTLHIKNVNIGKGNCNACKLKLANDGNIYFCHDCNFKLHLFCANLKPTLKYKCHKKHCLTYFRSNSEQNWFECKECGEYKKESAFYRCVQCDYSYHIHCLIPAKPVHRYHRHALEVMDSLQEDDCEEYYCDICEKERKPNYHVYCCKECTFIAHIECVLDKCVESTSSIKHNVAEQSDTKKIDYFLHQHPLSLKPKTGRFILRLYCKACQEEISDDEPSFGCKQCDFHLHKTCGGLPSELRHPLHKQHPLALWNVQPPYDNGFVCDACRGVSEGFMYQCYQCDFKLDMKCAADPRVKITPERELEQSKLSGHFIHPMHELVLGKISKTNKNKRACHICPLNIIGPAYCCFPCEFYFHESCVGEVTQKISLPSFHPQHSLALRPSVKEELLDCLACKSSIFEECYYSCSSCKIYLHFYCANSLSRPLRSKSHTHNLYLFQTKIFVHSCKKNYSNVFRLFCNNSKCQHGGLLKEKSVYRCIDCDFNFHLECVGVPSKEVQSKRHIHPLFLEDLFVEDNSGEYYCDICEEKRDPREDVYHCRKCISFVAHIECVMEEMVEKSSVTEVEATKDKWKILKHVGFSFKELLSMDIDRCSFLLEKATDVFVIKDDEKHIMEWLINKLKDFYGLKDDEEEEDNDDAVEVQRRAWWKYMEYFNPRRGIY